MVQELRLKLKSKMTRERLAKFLEPHSTKQLVLEIGANKKPYKMFFPNTISGDIVYFPGLDLQFDAHHIPFGDETFDLLLCTEVLEHCINPQKVIDEFHRVLKPQGKLILTTRFVFPIHDAPYDYFRFTRYGLEHMCRDFANTTVEEEALTMETYAILAQRLAYQVAWKLSFAGFALQILARLIARMQGLVQQEYGDYLRKFPIHNIMASGYYVIAVKS